MRSARVTGAWRCQRALRRTPRRYPSPAEREIRSACPSPDMPLVNSAFNHPSCPTCGARYVREKVPSRLDSWSTCRFTSAMPRSCDMKNERARERVGDVDGRDVYQSSTEGSSAFGQFRVWCVRLPFLVPRTCDEWIFHLEAMRARNSSSHAHPRARLKTLLQHSTELHRHRSKRWWAHDRRLARRPAASSSAPAPEFEHGAEPSRKRRARLVGSFR